MTDPSPSRSTSSCSQRVEGGSRVTREESHALFGDLTRIEMANVSRCRLARVESLVDAVEPGPDQPRENRNGLEVLSPARNSSRARLPGPGTRTSAARLPMPQQMCAGAQDAGCRRLYEFGVGAPSAVNASA